MVGTFVRELLAMCCAVLHFQHSVKGRKYALFPDHKSIRLSLDSSNKYSPRESRHLNHVSQLTEGTTDF